MKKRKDGLYRVSKVIDGKQKFFYGHSKAEAYQKREEYLNKAARDSYQFGPIAERWWEYHSPSLAFNTLKGYKPALRRAIEQFESVDITDITPVDISSYLHKMAKEKYADKTVRTQLMVISLIFRYAINYEGININNPARDVTVPKGLKKANVTMPCDEDIKRVKENVDAPFGLFPFMLMYTGMRRGELLALTGRDIDLDARTISITKSLYYENNHPRVKEPKTESGKRIIPILDTLMPYLKGIKKGPVFPGSETYLSDHEFFRNWDKYVAATGITCTPHQLRHCYATMLYENDVPAKDAQYLLGHAHLSTTMDIYTDIRTSKVRDIGQQIYSIDIKDK